MTKSWLMSIGAVVIGGIVLTVLMKWWDRRKSSTAGVATMPSVEQSVEQILAKEGF